MASQTIPTLTGDDAYAVIDAKSYGEWNGLLDLFDRLREETPVVRVENDDLHDPFWLVTRHEDVMRISKDNAAFLNNPRGIVFGLEGR